MNSVRLPIHRPALAIAASAFAVIGALSVHTPAAASQGGDLYVLTNQNAGNSVIVFARAADGSLTEGATFSTGGLGAGSGADPLGSQGSIAYQGGFVLAVNAGSNDVTVFRAVGHELALAGRFASGGTLPVSLDVRGDLVYVLNAGGTPNITGFYLDTDSGELRPMSNSQRPLAGGAAAKPAEVHFSADGRSLVVTEKGTQLIDTYTVGADGHATGPYSYASSGAVPFGFSVTRRGYAVVTEAGGGSVSSYDIGDNGSLRLVSASVALGQQAVCWLATTGDGRFAYSANAASNTISSLSIAADGTLGLQNVAAATPAAPLDLAITADSRALYVRDGNGAVTGYRVGEDGSLALINTAGGVPAGSQGIAVR